MTTNFLGYLLLIFFVLILIVYLGITSTDIGFNYSKYFLPESWLNWARGSKDQPNGNSSSTNPTNGTSSETPTTTLPPNETTPSQPVTEGMRLRYYRR